MGSSVHDILATSTKSNSNGRAKSSGMDRSNSDKEIEDLKRQLAMRENKRKRR